MRALGVGLVYWPALAPLFDADGVVDVLELEPQGLWEKICGSGSWRYHPNEAALAAAAAYPHVKLLHGVGQPFGGATPDPISHLPLLRSAVRSLQPAWVSEHLSVNRTRRTGAVEDAGFLLPPRQTPAAARVAAANVRGYGRALDCPVAIETGVNYLAPRSDECSDGAYFREVAQGADCGILLDLHNLWCNELNGRARVRDVLAELPLDRVWEVHLAGGTEHDGFALDAHSGRVHPDLLALAAEVVPSLPALGALIFEILPEHLGAIGLDGVHEQLADLRELWTLRRPRPVTPALGTSLRERRLDDLAEVRAWEDELVGALRGDAVAEPRFAGLADDPGIAIYRELIGDVRRAAAARCLRYTTTALLLAFGAADVRTLLDGCFAAHPPDAFLAVDAERLAAALGRCRDLLACVPHLASVLDFEHALLRAALYGETHVVDWTADPNEVLGALEGNVLPRDLRRVPSRMRIVA
jgi:uncharacterized protein (UPF0276 family)